jgi:hypothetical protein
LPDTGDHRLRRKGQQQSDSRSSCHLLAHGLDLGWHGSECGDWFHSDRDDHCDPNFSSHGGS